MAEEAVNWAGADWSCEWRPETQRDESVNKWWESVVRAERKSEKNI
jgi:hypothetical protein